MIVYVRLSSDGETIVAYFSGPQDPEMVPNVIEMETSDPRYHAYVQSMPEPLRGAFPPPTDP